MNQHVQITPQARALLSRLDALPSAAGEAIAAAMNTVMDATVSHIQGKYMSFSKAGPSQPDGLRVITGSARRAVTFFPCRVNGNTVTGSIGGLATNKGVNYVVVHEFGATIPDRVAPPGKALRFAGSSGEIIFRKRAKGFTLPPRQMIARGIADMLPEFGEAITGAIVNTLSP